MASNYTVTARRFGTPTMPISRADSRASVGATRQSRRFELQLAGGFAEFDINQSAPAFLFFPYSNASDGETRLLQQDRLRPPA
jgi:hypothetical protein